MITDQAQLLEDISKSFEKIDQISKNLKSCLDDACEKSSLLHKIQDINQESKQKYINNLEKLKENSMIIEEIGIFLNEISSTIL